MPTVKPVAYEDASPEVRAVYDSIMEARGIDFVPNFWRTIANHPPTLARLWDEIRETMADGALPAKTKEMIALAVSASNGCAYCVSSHTLAARNLGMSDQELGELMAVVGAFNKTNRVAEGYQVEIDDQIVEGLRRLAD